MIEYAQIIASSRVHKFLYNYSELLASPISMLAYSFFKSLIANKIAVTTTFSIKFARIT